MTKMKLEYLFKLKLLSILLLIIKGNIYLVAGDRKKSLDTLQQAQREAEQLGQIIKETN